MFHKAWDWVKGHPYIAAAIAGVVVLFFLWPKKSSGSGAPDLSAYYGAAAAATQAATATNIAHDQATLGYNTAKAGYDTAAAIAKTQSDRDVALATILAGTQLSGSQQVEIAHEAVSASTVQHVADTTRDQNIASTQATAATDIAQIGASRDVALGAQGASRDVALGAQDLAGREFAGTIGAYQSGLAARTTVWQSLLNFIATTGQASPVADIASFTPLPDPTSLGISAARYGAASTGATNTNPNAGYPVYDYVHGTASNDATQYGTYSNPGSAPPSLVPGAATVLQFPKISAFQGITDAVTNNPSSGGISSLIDVLFGGGKAA